MDAKFTDLIKVENGTISVKGSAEMEAIQNLMRQTAASNSKELHVLMGAGVREPIRQLSRYKEWGYSFFTDWAVALGEDNRIPLDQPIGTAFLSSPEGRAVFVTPGTQLWTRPSFYEVKGALRIYWKTLQTAGWPLLQRRLEEVADDMAFKRDKVAKSVIDTAVASVAGHTFSSTGALLNKSAVDAVIKAAAAIGYQVTQMAINPSRLADMAGWTNGSTAALPFFWMPQEKGGQVFQKLYADGYAGLTYILSHNLDVNTVYLSGVPAEIGYHQQHGTTQSASDVNIEDGVDLHVIREDHAWYVSNPYNLWKINITA